MSTPPIWELYSSTSFGLLISSVPSSAEQDRRLNATKSVQEVVDSKVTSRLSLHFRQVMLFVTSLYTSPGKLCLHCIIMYLSDYLLELLWDPTPICSQFPLPQTRGCGGQRIEQVRCKNYQCKCGSLCGLGLKLISWPHCEQGLTLELCYSPCL